MGVWVKMEWINMSEIKQEMRTRIDKDVDSLLKQSGYSEDTDSYVDIIDFVNHYGFDVVNADLEEKDDGFIAITANLKLIAVNSKRSLEWKRFVIAHEFAHSILHYKQGDSAYLHRENVKGKNESENAADYFAAALLLPVRSFSSEYQKLKSKNLSENAICMQLSSIFKVPLESVSRRILELNLQSV